MKSVRAIAACIGIHSPFSMMRDFFGFTTGKVPQLGGADPKISLLKQVKLLEQKHFHINLIRIGSDQFTASDNVEIDSAVHKARSIYAQVNVGIGRVRHFAVPTADADGHEIIDNDSEASDLTNAFTVHNNAIDVFVVRDYVGNTIGLSPIDGTCNKDKTSKMNGSVVEISNGTQQTARSMSHEIGHYLGLDHQNDQPTNLMCQSSVASNVTTSVVLTSAQRDEIRDHCFIENAC